MLSKFTNKSAQKVSIFPSKANYARSLFILSCLLFLASCSSSTSSSDVYRIARDPSWYPMTLMGKEPGVLGFSDDLVNAIAEQAFLKIQLYTSSSISLEYGLNEHHWEAILSSIPPIVGYNQIYSFSDPYLLLGPVLVVPIYSTASTLEDLKGKEVGILSGSSSVTLLEQHPEIIIRPYNSFPSALESLTEQNIDAMLMPALVAYGYVKDIYYGQLKVIDPPLTQEGLRLVTLFDQDPLLIEKFNEGLKKLKESGQYDALLSKWHLR